MQHGIPEDASGLSDARSFGRAGAGSIPCEELATTTSTVLRTKRSVPSRISHSSAWGAREVRDALLALFPVTCTGSSPALPVVCNMVDRHDGREDDGRAARIRGRRGLCRRDHPRATRCSLAHIRFQLRAQSGSAASSTPASVSWVTNRCGR
jgi:hypothetical protein